MRLKRFQFSKKTCLLYGAVLLLFPALLIHLGLIAFYDDEGIRSLVALEMMLSGNYITPSLFGEFYYNKPPLYNWILVFFFNLTGNLDELTARLPTVFFLIVYAATIYYFLRKNFQSSESAGHLPLLSAFAFITCGRILFWDSMLALIDICFSWVIFCMFMFIYLKGERKRYGAMFILAYLLAAIGFLLKGLPSVVFLAISLSSYLIWQKKWRLFISWQHFAGAMIFFLIVGSYYAVYAQFNGLEVVFRTLFDESAKRTFVEYGFRQTVLHLFTFPFEMCYHFLPWTILAVYFFRKDSWRLVLQNKFLTWNAIIFFATILPYWSSVEVYPRYLFMHVPLVFTVMLFLHFKNGEEGTTMHKTVEVVFLILCIASVVVSLSPNFITILKGQPDLVVKTMTLSSAIAVLAWLYWRWKLHRLMIFVLVMLLLRIGFNWFVLPSRLKVECSTAVRQTTIEAAKSMGERPLYILEYSLGLQPITGFYFTRETGKILRIHFDNFDENALYIINPGSYHKDRYEEITRFKIKWECGERIIGKLNE